MNRHILYAQLILVLTTLPSLIRSQYSVEDTSSCRFPFNYGESSYESCIKEDRRYPWCSLTEDYMGIWDYCHDQRKTDWTCVTECAVNPDDYTGFPSCLSNTGRNMYCVDQIQTIGVKEGSCDKSFSDISPYHTACLPPLRYVAKSGLPESEIPSILEMHNNWRRKVSPTAAGMQKLYWDERYAYVAQKHADRCSYWHDVYYLRGVPGTGLDSGQNIVMVTGMRQYNLTYSFDSMFAGEMVRWDYGLGVKEDFVSRGQNALHYTQILLESASRVGCGISSCVFADRVERLFVCNYNALQNSEQIIKPYTEGPTCSLCPDRCDNGLCDCGGMECYNGGALNVNTCKCTCAGLWTGEKCESLIEQVFDETTGCYNPFLFNGQLIYGCMPYGSNFICSMNPKFTGIEDEMIFCASATGMKRSINKFGGFEKNSNFMSSPSEFKKVNKSRHHGHSNQYQMKRLFDFKGDLSQTSGRKHMGSKFIKGGGGKNKISDSIDRRSNNFERYNQKYKVKFNNND